MRIRVAPIAPAITAFIVAALVVMQRELQRVGLVAARLDHPLAGTAAVSMRDNQDREAAEYKKKAQGHRLQFSEEHKALLRMWRQRCGRLRSGYRGRRKRLRSLLTAFCLEEVIVR